MQRPAATMHNTCIRTSAIFGPQTYFYFRDMQVLVESRNGYLKGYKGPSISFWFEDASPISTIVIILATTKQDNDHGFWLLGT